MSRILKIVSEHTGGNCRADVVQHVSGRVIVIADECIFSYPNRATWNDGVTNPFAFIASRDVYEPDGPCTVDILTLADGRVVGIDSNSVHVYASRAAFDALSEDGDASGIIASQEWEII